MALRCSYPRDRRRKTGKRRIHARSQGDGHEWAADGGQRAIISIEKRLEGIIT